MRIDVKAVKVCKAQIDTRSIRFFLTKYILYRCQLSSHDWVYWNPFRKFNLWSKWIVFA